jgi:hypothetical protein
VPDRPLTTVTIITADSIQPDATAHTRSWELPAVDSGVLAAYLIERYGDPVEGFVPVGSMTDLAKVPGHLFIEERQDD